MYDVNLYPPIFNQSYMPAFIASTKCKVYFQISPLNDLNDLYHITPENYGGIQVSVRKQRNNDSALIKEYKNDIMLVNLQMENNKYFIEINNSDIQGGFSINEYYKVQIRFTSSQIFGVLPDAKTAAFRDWLETNAQYFSEWSSIVLIRGINEPELEFTVNGKSGTNIQVTSDYVEIKGSVTFPVNETEKLQKYRIILYRPSQIVVDSDGVSAGLDIQEDSGDIYSVDGLIDYNISTVLSQGISYKLQLILTTNNLYQWSPDDKTLTLQEITPMEADIELKQEVNNHTGCIKLILKRNMNYVNQNLGTIQQYYTFIEEPDQSFSLASAESVSEQTIVEEQYDSMGYDGATVKFDPYWQRMLYYDEFNTNFLFVGDTIIIRRSSSNDDFKTWKLLSNFTITEQNVAELYWFDYTAEPGVWYRYQIVRYDNENRRTAELVTDIEHPVMLDTEDIFLNSDGEELILRFDPVINNFSNKIAESITDTIGSKYPFIRRNGNVNYRTFALSGTISCFMDVQH